MFRKDHLGKALLFFLLLAPAASSQTPAETPKPANIGLNRNRGLEMLDEIKTVIRENYYDKNFRGINLNERFKTAAERIKKADYNAQIFRIIAQVLLDFEDSHTLFYPPDRVNHVQYGFSLQMIGAKCFVVDVKKDSDAEKKGLKVGDEIVGIGKIAPDRKNLWKIEYLIYALDPKETIELFILDPGGAERSVQIKAVFETPEERKKELKNRREKKKTDPYECRNLNAELIACKLRTFSTDKKYIDKMMSEVGSHKKMILDLRGNHGGYVHIEEYLTGYFFDREVKIAAFTMRNKTSDRIAKPQKGKVYKDELIVLIDSESASASEVFARVVQLEKRGRIFGDVSAGAVMTSMFFPLANIRGPTDFMTYSFYGLSVTVGDLVMSDGNRLEDQGVVPDFLMGPTGDALAKKYDPVLGYVLQVFGTKITDAEAGQFYFLTPKPEDEDEESEDVETVGNSRSLLISNPPKKR